MKTNSIFIAWFNTLGEAYVFANQAILLGAQLKEIFLIGTIGHVILKIDEDILNQVLSQKNPKPKLSKFIKNLNAKTEKAWLCLENKTIGDALLILEGDFVGDVLAFINEASELDFDILDIRMSRSANSKTYCILTSASNTCQSLCKKTHENLSISLIENVSEEIKEMFQAHL